MSLRGSLAPRAAGARPTSPPTPEAADAAEAAARRRANGGANGAGDGAGPFAPARPAPGGLRRGGRPLSAREIALRYLAFAAVAVLCNLAAQRLVLAALRQAETVAFGWAPGLLDWALADMLGLLKTGWRAGIGGPLGLTLAICAGTGVGLVVKYLLDKRWIFRDRSSGAAAHARRFGLYAATGVITTAIFWGAEAAAWAIWGTHPAREAGAALGLGLGYLCKYRLDRRLVFTPGAGMGTGSGTGSGTATGTGLGTANDREAGS